MPMGEMTAEQIEMFTNFSKIKWMMPLVGAIEVLGGLLFMIPKTRALGAIVILPVMVGIVVHHATYEPSSILMPLILFAINLWMILDNWKKYEPMVN